MAQAKTVTVFECDGCGYLVQAKHDGKPKGIHGVVTEVHPDGNEGPVEFYAHTDRCLKSSIVKVLGL